MSLKDVIAADLSAVFFNIDEFAEQHDINGTSMPVIIDEDVLKERSNNKSETFDGVYRGEVVLFVKAADLLKRPVKGQPLRLDGRLMMVGSCSESNGMLEIALEANES